MCFVTLHLLTWFFFQQDVSKLKWVRERHCDPRNISQPTSIGNHVLHHGIVVSWFQIHEELCVKKNLLFPPPHWYFLFLFLSWDKWHRQIPARIVIYCFPPTWLIWLLGCQITQLISGGTKNRAPSLNLASKVRNEVLDYPRKLNVAIRCWKNSILLLTDSLLF